MDIERKRSIPLAVRITLAEHVERVIAGNSQLVERLQGLRDLRAKEGRALSPAAYQKVNEVADSLQALVDEFDLLLELNDTLQQKAA